MRAFNCHIILRHLVLPWYFVTESLLSGLCMKPNHQECVILCAYSVSYIFSIEESIHATRSSSRWLAQATYNLARWKNAGTVYSCHLRSYWRPYPAKIVTHPGPPFP